jgi:hypothetical protein
VAKYFRLALPAQMLVAIFIFATPASSQLSYYVSLTGKDNNPGTELKPFRTVAHARDVVRSVNHDMTQDVIVYIRGGFYSLDETLTLDTRDSGMNGHVVTYKSSPGERVILSAGKRITGWERDLGSRWKATTEIPDFRQLYVNGKRATRATGGPPPALELYGADGYKTSDVDMARWKNQADIDFLYDKQWERSICKVANITKQDSSVIITMQQPYFTLLKLKEGIQPVLPNFMQNALELLTQPGEWYLDKHTHQVYYIPRLGEVMEEAQVIAPVLEELLDVRGSLDEPVHDIKFEGITFSHTSWLRPNQIGLIDMQANFIITPTNLVARAGGHVANLHNEYTKSPSGIVLHAAKGIRFERCTFNQFGSGGIDVEFGSQDNLFLGNKFFDLSGTAIQLGDVIAHHPPDPREIVRDNRVLNNYIHDVAVEYTAGVGIFAGYTSGTVISHNEISNLPYSAISIGWGWGEEDPGGGAAPYFQPFVYEDPTPSRDVHCEYNYIHDTMKQHWDGGGIYTIGDMPGTIIRGNVVHDSQGKPGGIYFDEGSAHIEATGNVVYNVPKAMNFNNRAQNRIATCRVHDNYFDIKPRELDFPKAVDDKAGLEFAYRDLLQQSDYVQ